MLQPWLLACSSLLDLANRASAWHACLPRHSPQAQGTTWCGAARSPCMPSSQVGALRATWLLAMQTAASAALVWPACASLAPTWPRHAPTNSSAAFALVAPAVPNIPTATIKKKRGFFGGKKAAAAAQEAEEAAQAAAQAAAATTVEVHVVNEEAGSQVRAAGGYRNQQGSEAVQCAACMAPGTSASEGSTAWNGLVDQDV